MIDLDKSKTKILELLSEELRWWYGLELVEASDGVLRDSTIYVYLRSLRKADYIKARKETDDEFGDRSSRALRNRLYHIKDQGFRALRERPSGHPADLLPSMA